MNRESVVHLVAGGADLHAPQANTVVENEVVALAVSLGLSYGKAFGDGPAHEGEFTFLATALGRARMPDVAGRATLAWTDGMLNG